MGTKIYFADVTPLYDEKIFSEKYNEISDYRKEKIDRMKFNKDKCLSLGAGLLLKEALAECGIDEKKAVYFTGKNGKPCIKDLPLYFNLSHSQSRVMCAVSDCPIGCDIEFIKDADLKIADRFFTESEVKQINKSRDLFYRFWTLKESFMKATGLGMSLALNSFSINIENQITVEQTLNDNNYLFFEFDFDKNYKSACCIENPTGKNNPVISEIKF